MPDNNIPQNAEIELLDIRQGEWLGRLFRVSLVAELPIDPDEAEEILNIFGSMYRSLTGEHSSSARQLLLVKYSALQLVITTYIATENYDKGGLWPQLSTAIGVPNTQPFHQEWGSAFIANLERLGLASFRNIEDAGQTYIGRILIHTGIPTRCLDDYYRIITEQRKNKPDLLAEEFVSWAKGKAQEGRLYNVDTPVKRFLQFGGEFAVDVTDRCFDLLDSVVDNDNTNDALLPERFVTKAIELAKSGKISSNSGSVARQHSQRPRLALDLLNGNPVIKLPSVSRSGDESVVWKVVFDNNDPEIITSTVLWPGSNEPAPELSVAIHRPARLSSVTFQKPLGLTVNLGIINDNDPLIAFEEDGTLIPASFDLPSGPTWLLTPVAPTDLAHEGEIKTIASSALPTGWDGWFLTLLDLTDTRSIAVDDKTSKRRVRAFKSAQIAMNSPVEYLRTLTGGHVYSTIPRVDLPSDAEWEISLLDSDRRLVNKLSSHTIIEQDELWANETRPLLGEYTIRVRGPWGRGSSMTFYIAEGLEVVASPSFRMMNKNGLDISKVIVKPTEGMEVDQSNRVLLSDRVKDIIRVSSNSQDAYLSLTVPYMHIAHHSDHKVGQQSTRSLTVYTEDVLENPGILVVSLSEAESPTFYMSVDGKDVQTCPAQSYTNGAYRLNLARITETLSRFKQLVVKFGDQKTPVMSIRPKRLFSSAELSAEGGKIIFSDCVDMNGMTALLYTATAPWHAAWVAPVEKSACDLPPELLMAGDLIVLLRIEDAWAPSPPTPEWPHEEETVVIHNDGYYKSDREEENSVSEFLAGTAKQLPETIKNFSIIWSVYNNILPGLKHNDSTSHIVTSINKALKTQALEALQTLEDSSLPNQDIASVLISSGMVWSDLRGYSLSKEPTWTMRNALPSTLLSAADRIWSDDEIDSSIEVLGDSARGILGSQDPYASSGRFDEGSDRFAANPNLREHFIHSMNLIPSGILSADNRVSASLVLLENINSENNQWMITNASNIISYAEDVLRQVDSPSVSNALATRQHPFTKDGWQAIPAASLGISILARYASRGNDFALKYFEYSEEDSLSLGDIARIQAILNRRQGWSNFAKVAPDLTTIDIILAELLITSTERSKDTA